MSFAEFTRPDGFPVLIRIAEIASHEEVPPPGAPKASILKHGTRIWHMSGRMQDVQEALPEVARVLNLTLPGY